MTEPIDAYVEECKKRQVGRRCWLTGVLRLLKEDTSAVSLSNKLKKLNIRVRNTHLFRHMVDCYNSGIYKDYEKFDEFYPKRTLKKENSKDIISLAEDIKNLDIGIVKLNNENSMYLRMFNGVPRLEVATHDKANKRHKKRVPITGRVRQELVKLRAYRCMPHSDPRLRGGCVYSICCQNCYNFYELYIHSESPLLKIFDDIQDEFAKGFVCFLCRRVFDKIFDRGPLFRRIRQICGDDTGQLYCEEMNEVLEMISCPYLMCFKCGGLVSLDAPIPRRLSKRDCHDLWGGYLCLKCDYTTKMEFDSGIQRFIRRYANKEARNVTIDEAYSRSYLYNKIKHLSWSYDIGRRVFYSYIRYRIIDDILYIMLESSEIIVGKCEFRYIDKHGTWWFDNIQQLCDALDLFLPFFSPMRRTVDSSQLGEQFINFSLLKDSEKL